MKVGTKLASGFGVVVALLVIIAAISLRDMGNLNQEVNDLVNDKFAKTVLANDIVNNVNEIARAMRNSLLVKDPADVIKELDKIPEARKNITADLDKLEAMIYLEKGKVIFKDVLNARTKYVVTQEHFMKLVAEGKRDEAIIYMMGEVRQLQAAYIEGVHKLIVFQTELMEDTGKKAGEQVSSAITQIIILGLLAALAGIAIGYLITRSLANSLGGEPDYAADVARKIAAGDLSTDLTINHGDNSSMVFAMKAMQESLKQIVAEIQMVVNAAVQGDFSKKMDLRGKQGFGRDIATELNQLSNTVDEAFKDTIRVTNALAVGDLSQKVTKEYAGAYNQVKVSVNTTADSLIKIVGEIQNLVEAAAKRGDFSVKMDLNGKLGYTKTLSELLNQLSNVTETSLNELAHMLRALSQGDLNEKITNQYYGIFGQLTDDANSTAEQLKEIIINEVGRVLEALSRGDLTEKISNDYPGAFGQLKDDANTTVAKLMEIISQVKDSTDMINTASQEIAQGNADLSQRTEEQASSLEETASSMEELTSTVKQNSENAKQANQLSMNASDIAVKGGKVVGEVVDTMASISTSSKKIVDIISVIEGIAFQTNILALNAAVEAARAGEQGRGFAVVAAEVRNLAQRSAAAAKEIKNLIDDSVDKVDTGSQQVNQAGATMNEIVTAVRRVTDIMAEIAAASNEQSAGIEQVNQAITQMDEVTQQNAALVEEAAAAAESMQDQANALTGAVSVFKLEAGGMQTATAYRVVAQRYVT